MSAFQNDTREWLEPDGLGGFASGTVSGIRTRRYHALLLVAMHPPAGRVALLNGIDAWVETRSGTFPISTQRYAGNSVWPTGHELLRDFTTELWPTWTFALPDGTVVRQELFVPRDRPAVALRWSIEGDRPGVHLHVRPFLSGRDYHSLHHENPSFRFEHQMCETMVSWQPYADLPRVFAESNATYEARPDWYRTFWYEREQQRGLDATEDLGSPGEFHWNLENNDAVLLLAAGQRFSELVDRAERQPREIYRATEAAERARRRQLSRLDQAALAYFARRSEGTTVIAGYPWFTDWGRDTFIAMRGFCLQPERLDVAQQILRAWAGTVSQGMLPNRFPDDGDEPEYNSVDASLWFIVAVHDFLATLRLHGRKTPKNIRSQLDAAVDAILTGYSRGTRYGIQRDSDGLLAAGQTGLQLTWMDAKVGDWVVTPRIGKPVEIQALWLNALWLAGQTDTRWLRDFDRARTAFVERFWNPGGDCLFDVVDVDHQAGAVDASFRPNQIFAVGGLPVEVLEGERAERVVAAVESRLLTPMGLRSLDCGDPRYRPHYQGGVLDRDSAYHQGTVWPWLMGPFVEAWVRVRGNTNAAKREARARFVAPFRDSHLSEAGLDHVSEIADGDPPHTPRGCPFQAWSLGELLRLENRVLCEVNEDGPRALGEARTRTHLPGAIR